MTRTLTRSTVLTVGGVALAAALVAAAFVVDNWVEGNAQAEVKARMDGHSLRDVDEAHRGLQRRYVSKREWVESNHRIDKRLTNIEKTLKDKLPNLRRWFDLGVYPVPRRGRGRQR
jgi:hypothetical protein